MGVAVGTAMGATVGRALRGDVATVESTAGVAVVRTRVVVGAVVDGEVGTPVG